jgi:hypothetical protein
VLSHRLSTGKQAGGCTPRWACRSAWRGDRIGWPACRAARRFLLPCVLLRAMCHVPAEVTVRRLPSAGCVVYEIGPAAEDPGRRRRPPVGVEERHAAVGLPVRVWSGHRGEPALNGGSSAGARALSSASRKTICPNRSARASLRWERTISMWVVVCPSVHVPARRSCLVHCDPGAGGRPGTRGVTPSCHRRRRGRRPQRLCVALPAHCDRPLHTWPRRQACCRPAEGRDVVTAPRAGGPSARWVGRSRRPGHRSSNRSAGLLRALRRPAPPPRSSGRSSSP